ncbi:hypothetical protein ACE1ET_09230 [Saccharicrinis sp. FJH62]|uniref:hypothetical protein n=1 Tax=Saccharicrinis sp. FJH62 TaxID=3344657 RepID=UPI0035D3E218
MEELDKQYLRWVQMVQWEAFSLYWMSNLILWFPWSFSPHLGMILMLTSGTFIWTWGSFHALRRFPGELLYKAALIVAILFVSISVFMNYIFFDVIRNGAEDLYQPTTYYGYAFVAAVPFLEVLILKNRLQLKKLVLKKGLILYGAPGIISIILLALIILLDIKL